MLPSPLVNITSIRNTDLHPSNNTTNDQHLIPPPDCLTKGEGFFQSSKTYKGHHQQQLFGEPSSRPPANNAGTRKKLDPPNPLAKSKTNDAPGACLLSFHSEWRDAPQAIFNTVKKKASIGLEPHGHPPFGSSFT